MDSLPSSASTTPPRGMHGLSMVMKGAISGFVLGGIAAAASMWIPINRIVVFNQPYSTYMHISSVRISRPGFLVLYVDKGGGLASETPMYLPAGYWRNIAVPIDTEDITLRAPKPILFVARLFVDDGDMMFDEKKDVPVKDVFRRLLSKHFWMEYSARPFVRISKELLLRPIEYGLDVMFP